ncbi:MAG TPA: hypothetical protein VGK20_18740 [Candidatus Binatia bacterium]|jgi:hypothetical protein
MSRFHFMTISKCSRRRVALGALAAALVCPVSSFAFYQETKLEGEVGSDIGGVWLSVQQVMPEFRISYPKPVAPRPPLPFSVGPIPADLEPLLGKGSAGVIVTGCSDEAFCRSNSILTGDVLLKINTNDITDVDSFHKVASGDLPPSILLSMRRPALKQTSARLMKIRYTGSGKETAQGSELQEKLELRVLDVKLPFSDEIAKTYETHQTFAPSAAQLENLGKTWAELPTNAPPLLFKASHRAVAKDNFDEALSSDQALTKSRLAFVMDFEGNPTIGGGGGGKLVDLYGIETIEPKSMDGNYISVAIANAPFPINIEFKGRFHMTRVADYSDKDDELRAKEEQAKPREDLSKYKTLPDVPAPSKAPDKK